MSAAQHVSKSPDECFDARPQLSQETLPPEPKILRTLDRGALFLLALLVTSPAWAFTAPTAGDLAFEIYDIVINDGIEGPIGAMIAVASIVFGIFGIANRNWFAMGGGFAGTTAMVAGEDIVTTVGYLI